MFQFSSMYFTTLSIFPLSYSSCVNLKHSSLLTLLQSIYLAISSGIKNKFTPSRFSDCKSPWLTSTITSASQFFALITDCKFSFNTVLLFFLKILKCPSCPTCEFLPLVTQGTMAIFLSLTCPPFPLLITSDFSNSLYW